MKTTVKVKKITTKNLFPLFLFAILGFSSTQLFAQDPPKNVPFNPLIQTYNVSTVEHLDSVAAAVNNGWEGIGYTIKLMNDIGSVSNEFKNTIGIYVQFYAAPFCGTFDGNNKKVLVKISQNIGNVGFFGFTSGAYIKNLTVDGEVIGLRNVGGIVGFAGDTRIDYCTNLASVTAWDIPNNLPTIYAGGIVGLVDINQNPVYIKHCVNSGEIGGFTVLGGIIGDAEGDARIENCLNIGTVIGYNDIGGISGTAAYSTEHCMNAGYIRGRDYVGGIAGNVTNGGSGCSMSYCLNVGVVVEHYGNNGRVGGIIGANVSNQMNISKCFNDLQMCTSKGICGADVPGKAVSFVTRNLCGDALQSPITGMGTAFWTYYGKLDDYNYPVLTNAGNNYNGNDVDFANARMRSVAGSTVRLSELPNVENTQDIKSRLFETYCYTSDVNWTATLGRVQNRIPNIMWDCQGPAGSEMMLCSNGQFEREVPLKFLQQIRKENIETATVTPFACEVNPAVVNDFATINVTSLNEGYLNISIFDATGAKVMEVCDKYIDESTLSEKFELNNLNNLSAGMYTVLANSTSGVTIKTFIKK